jgi:hypothetical protein
VSAWARPALILALVAAMWVAVVALTVVGLR